MFFRKPIISWVKKHPTSLKPSRQLRRCQRLSSNEGKVSTNLIEKSIATNEALANTLIVIIQDATTEEYILAKSYILWKRLPRPKIRFISVAKVMKDHRRVGSAANHVLTHSKSQSILFINQNHLTYSYKL